jgi:CDP-diacylglycerol---glycerol-3-phosphate 3-phosphatidyltransferase
MKKQIPYLLVWFRAALAMLVLILALIKNRDFNALIAWSIPLAVISDIFDGIIARKLGVSTEKLRRLDSQIDLFYWLSMLIAFILRVPDAQSIFWPWIALCVALEASLYIYSFIRFGKEPCTHALLSKTWCLFLAGALFYSFLTSTSGWLVASFIFGYLSQLDVLLILILLPNWQRDIPSSYQAWQIRKGQPIKKHPLFNG